MGKVPYHATETQLWLPIMDKVLAMVGAEVERSIDLHGCPNWGRHEAYAIIKEEVDEAWDAIKANSGPDELVIELIQVAAMCVRYLATDLLMQDSVLNSRLGLLGELAHRAGRGVVDKPEGIRQQRIEEATLGEEDVFQNAPTQT